MANSKKSEPTFNSKSGSKSESASKSRSSLGRGFESLIPTNFALHDVVTPGEQIRQILLTDIIANPDQPRKTFDDNALRELADSIKKHGIIQPIVVTPLNNTHVPVSYRIVAGERRYRAAILAGLDKISAIVRNHEELEELEISIVENVQRVDLSPLEQAVSIARLRDQFSLTPKQIAEKIGKHETTVSNIIRLLQLPAEAVKAMQENRITEGHARTILSLKRDESGQIDLLNKIITQELTVREAEKLVQVAKGIATPKSRVNSPKTIELLSRLHTPVAKTIKVKEKTKSTGVIQLSYSSLTQLEDYLEALNKSSN